MPSGFQQDNNQLQPALYRVVINMSNFRDEDDTTGGRIIPWAWDNFEGNTLPSTLNNAMKLARGNVRFQRIIDELTKYNDGQILDVELSVDGNSFNDANLVPTAIAFTIKYERFVFGANGSDLGDDEDNLLEAAERKYLNAYWNNTDTNSEYDGENINHPDEAIQNMIMRALIGVRINSNNDNVKHYTKSFRVFHPVDGSDPITGEGYQEVVEIGDVTNGEDTMSWNDLRNNISVNLMDGTTLFNPGWDNDAQTTTP